MKRKKLALASEGNSEEEEGGLLRKVIKKDAFDDDEEEEEDESLDRFQNDGFLVFDDEVEGQKDVNMKGDKEKMKKRKMRSLKDFVLDDDDDDVDLLEENRILGISQFPNESNKFKRLENAGTSTKVVKEYNVSDIDEGFLLDNISGEEEASYDSEEDEMANFIVDDRESCRKRSPLRKLNQKESKQLVTICSFAPSYTGPIIGDANEILKQKKQVLPISVNPDESCDFEPLFLAEKYMNERNTLVTDTDVPERLQMVEEIVGSFPLDQLSREEESIWMLNQLVRNSYMFFCKNIVPERSDDVLSKIKKEDIMNFLELYHVEKFDIPFIAMYRKEQCLSLLENMEQDEAESKDDDDDGQPCRLKWHRALWVIKELDKKWLLLKRRKSALKMYQTKHYDDSSVVSDNSEKYNLNMDVFDSISKSLNEAESEEEINDCDMKFRLHFPYVEERIDGNFKRPIKNSLYSNCMKAGLWKLASQFGSTSEQLGLQITLEKMDVEFQEQPDESPEEVALNFTCSMFETPELVLKGARHMASLEIGCEPCIKKHIRHIFMEKAVVSTSPTHEGNVTIDCFHQYSGVKWLRDKPLSKFDGAQWLLIQKAEEENLLLVSIKLPEETLKEVITGFSDVYVIDGIGKSAQLWKKQCKLILDDAFLNFLLPSMEKEARKLLTSRAKHWLLADYGKEFWKTVCVGPYSYIENSNTGDSAEAVAPKVMSCCWGPGKPATTFVMLNSKGELLDVLEARSFNLRSQTIDDQQRKKYDQLKVFRFMKNHKPHVTVIGAANSSCVRLKEDVKELVSKLEESLRDLGQAINGITVVYGDESLPQLYESSRISSDQLPGQPGIVKRAVALGRYLQNPLAMVATLCGANREILSLKLSLLEHLLTPDEKYEMIEQVMIDVTNQVGVDINLCLTHDCYFPLLQFVSGLGPLKAACLERDLMGRSVNNRLELAKYGIKTKVFHNAVGFMCIQASLLPHTSFDIDMLDGTRIHPESYELAEGLAKAVCNDITVSPFEYVKKEPEAMIRFDINEYSDNYESKEGENKRETFLLIKNELLHGFQDPRNPYKEPSPNEEFNMICGKNGAPLAEGRVVQVTVRHVQSQRAFCVLDSGLTGIIMKGDFSDEDGEFSMADKLHEGDKVLCKVKQIDKIKCHVLLTCKQSETERSSNEDIHELDPYYRESGSVLLNQKAGTDEKKLNRFFKPRAISHPCFKNMTMDQSMEFLSDKDVGECIFRPSSRGPSYLTLTLKVVNKLYVHKDIVEKGKDLEDMQSYLHLGKTLKIGDHTFGDLDEVMDRYVVPLVKHLKEMLSFRKFRRGSKTEIDEVLKAEKSEYPNRVVFCLGVSYEHPGTFILSYIRSKNLHHEFVGLLPNGFRFRKRTFEKIEHLMGFFQKNIDSLQHRSPTSEHLAVGTSLRVSRGASTKWGNDTDISPNKKNSVSVARAVNWDGNGGNENHDSGGNSEVWNGGGNNTHGRRQGDGGCAQDPGHGSGWGGSKDCQSGGKEGGWHPSGNNTRGRGRLGGPGSRGGRTSGWGGTKEDESSGWHASGNVRGRGGGHRFGGRDQGTEHGDGHSSFWCSKEDETGGSNGGWRSSGNNTHGRGRNGGGWDDGPGRGGDHNDIWGGKKDEENRGNGGGWNASGNNRRGRGTYVGAYNQGRGRGGDNTGAWGRKEDDELGGNEGGWQASGNSTFGRGSGRYGGGGGGRTGGWSCTNEDDSMHGRGGWDSGRGGRGYGNDRSDNNQRESQFGHNSNQTWNNKNTNFHRGSTSGNWGQ